MPAQKAQRGPTRHDRPFHNVKAEYGRNSLAKGLKKGQLTPEDADLITEFSRGEKRTDPHAGQRTRGSVVMGTGRIILVCQGWVWGLGK